MQSSCEACGAAVAIQDDTRLLTCADCGTELAVHLGQSTIALKVKKPELNVNHGRKFVSELVDKLAAELRDLNTELARIRRRRITLAVVGGCCALAFAILAISTLLGGESNIGFSILLCAGGCAWFVLFVHRDGAASAANLALKAAEVKHRRAENQRICFAAKKGIHRVAIDLFLRELRYYPAWIQHSRRYVPSRVSEALKVDTDSVRLRLSGSDYLFTLVRECQNEERSPVEFALFVDDSLVLSAGADVLENQLLTRASGHFVNLIVEGAWIEELFALWAETAARLPLSRC